MQSFVCSSNLQAEIEAHQVSPAITRSIGTLNEAA
jgi:hypothetical protein